MKAPESRTDVVDEWDALLARASRFDGIVLMWAVAAASLFPAVIAGVGTLWNTALLDPTPYRGDSHPDEFSWIDVDVLLAVFFIVWAMTAVATKRVLVRAARRRPEAF